MEYISSDINRLLKTERTHFSENDLLKIVYHSLCALNFLHEANIMHRDIKSPNILITEDFDVKICDFGLSRSLPQSIMDHRGFNSMHIRSIANTKYEHGHFSGTNLLDETQNNHN